MDCGLVNRKGAKIRKYAIDTAERVDESVRQSIRKLFGCMDDAPEEEKLQAALRRQIAGNRAAQKKFELNMTYRQFCSEWGGGTLAREATG